jgi:hypothetical protein
MRSVAPYKLRAVVREFRAPSPEAPGVKVPHEELECGHIIIIRGRIGGPGSKEVALRDMNRKLTGKPVRRRCFECAKPVQEVPKLPRSNIASP